MRFDYITFRLLQQTISQTFDPLYEPKFSDRNMKKKNWTLARSEILTLSQNFTEQIIHAHRTTAGVSSHKKGVYATKEQKGQTSTTGTVTVENWSSVVISLPFPHKNKPQTFNI